MLVKINTKYVRGGIIHFPPGEHKFEIDNEMNCGVYVDTQGEEGLVLENFYIENAPIGVQFVNSNKPPVIRNLIKENMKRYNNYEKIGKRESTVIMDEFSKVTADQWAKRIEPVKVKTIINDLDFLSPINGPAPINKDKKMQTCECGDPDCEFNVRPEPALPYGWATNSMKKKKKKDTNPMYNTSASTLAVNVASAAPAKSEIETQREYLLKRLSAISWEKTASGKLKDQFHTRGLMPKTYGEARQFLKEGKFVLFDDDYKDEDEYDSWSNSFQWRDPARPKDWKGYYAAQEEIQQAETRAKDLIMVSSAEQGLAALQAFEDFQPTTEYNPEGSKRP